MQASRFSYTSVKDYMDMPYRDFVMVWNALKNVLERERAAREQAKK